MSIFMAMFTGAVVMMTKAMDTSRTISDAASQVDAAFRELDETVRSASFISTPEQGADQNWHVEMLSLERDGTQRCTELRVDSAAQKLQRRTWTAGSADRSDWVTIASGITNGGADTAPPFALTVATDVPMMFQQLVVTLVPQTGPGISPATAGSSFTVTALNSVAARAGTDGEPPCSGAGP